MTIPEIILSIGVGTALYVVGYLIAGWKWTDRIAEVRTEYREILRVKALEHEKALALAQHESFCEGIKAAMKARERQCDAAGRFV